MCRPSNSLKYNFGYACEVGDPVKMAVISIN